MKRFLHPPQFKDGTRVLFLKSRHKDGNETERTLLRITHSPPEFDRAMDELCGLMRPNERIYASASPRNLGGAARMLQHRAIDAAADPDPLEFYRKLEARWSSCLMAPENEDRSNKYWMFDCDGLNDLNNVDSFSELNKIEHAYAYPSKTGTHVLVRPFNRQLLPDSMQGLLHTNAMMLWAYS